MNIFRKNARTRKALGVISIEFQHYRAGLAHWLVVFEDGQQMAVVTHNFGTESSVLKFVADKWAKMGKQVVYPEGAA